MVNQQKQNESPLRSELLKQKFEAARKTGSCKKCGLSFDETIPFALSLSFSGMCPKCEFDNTMTFYEAGVTHD